MTAGYAVDSTGPDRPEDGQRAAAEEVTAGLVSVVIQPAGRRVGVPAGTSVLAAVRAAGLEVVSVCGGRGLCGTCRVLTVDGGLTPPTEPERELLAPAELSAGVRLACQAAVAADARIDVPPETLTAPQRLVFEGRAASVTALDPAVVTLDVQVSPPSVDDLRSDATRLQDAVTAAGQPVARTSLAVLSAASVTLRSRHWAARAAVHRAEMGDSGEIIALLPEGTTPLGAAIDVGTTKLAAYLVNLETGETVAKGAAANPQVTIGEDVMSRIAYADAREHGAHELHERLADGINGLLAKLRDQIRAPSWQVVDAVAVGNTAMHHLLVNLPVRQLGRAPYVPAVTQPLTLRATDIGLELAPGAKVYLPPNIAGFVGADHVAALLAADAAEDGRTVLVLDIGTNTEISVTSGGQRWACSCASGPAFEGAHIRDGMRAAAGAIERVSYLDGGFQVHTIGGGAPAGICGSGILDAVVAALAAGIVSERGRLSPAHPLVIRPAGEPAWVLVPAAQTAHGRDILLTRADIGEIQFAKAAIRAGIELLLAAADVDANALDEVIVAGAFGTYLDLTSAIAVGMLPPLPAGRFRQIGNAAGQGAQQLLVSRQRRRLAGQIARRVRYVELTTHPEFADAFAQELRLGQTILEPMKGGAG
jgi:uncharacterized 2Fe-2S/4Fe-4S cluster protein (DUF4445 family)